MIVNKHMTTSPYIVRELQIKTREHHCIAVRQVKTQTTDNTKCWCGYGATRTLILCWQECKIVASL